MPVNVPASRSGPDVTLANADEAGRPACAPLVAWGRVDRRRPVVAPLTLAPDFAALPGGGASPEGVLGSALVHALRQMSWTCGSRPPFRSNRHPG